MRILLSAGHSKADPGAIASTGQTEARTNMNVVNFAYVMLQDLGHEVILTRKSHDETVTIAQVQAAIRKFKPDLVIEVHHNANIKNANGAEICAQVQDGKSKHDETSYKLADAILREFEALGQRRRSIIRKANSTGTADYFGVLRQAAALKIPAVLTEFAFMSDADVGKIDTFNEQKAEAKAITNAVKKTFG